jgi:N6-adenosine-specific RNA methylase IME4
VVRPFGTAVIDPPWPYRKVNKSGPKSDPKMKGYVNYREEGRTLYETETLDLADLAALPVGDLVADYVFLWTTGPFLPHALDLIRAWGFEYVTMLTWLKTRPSGSWSYGAGYWYRGSVEQILVGKRKGSISVRTHQRNIFPAVRIGHSTKPEELQDHIETRPEIVKPDAPWFTGPYLELFARRDRPGWTCLGNECPSDGEDIRVSMANLLAAQTAQAVDAPPSSSACTSD